MDRQPVPLPPPPSLVLHPTSLVPELGKSLNLIGKNPLTRDLLMIFHYLIVLWSLHRLLHHLLPEKLLSSNPQNYLLNIWCVFPPSSYVLHQSVVESWPAASGTDTSSSLKREWHNTPHMRGFCTDRSQDPCFWKLMVQQNGVVAPYIAEANRKQ